MPESDTGLHVSMRLLLGIVAGLIIADLLKVLVQQVAEVPTSDASHQVELLVAGAALVFVTRVLADNGLYYSRPDARTTKPVYFSRMFLILLDLCSYAACYYVVVQVEAVVRGDGDTLGSLRATAYAMVSIEALHFAWSCLALLRLKIPRDSPDHEPRRSWLRRWAAVSGVNAALGGVVILTSRSRMWVDEDWVMFIVAYASTSAVLYVLSMRREYLGTWEHVRSQTPAATSAVTAADVPRSPG